MRNVTQAKVDLATMELGIIITMGGGEVMMEFTLAQVQAHFPGTGMGNGGGENCSYFGDIEEDDNEEDDG